MLTPTQLEDLARLHGLAREFAADVAIIGAAALLCFVDIGRFTRDIDLAVALDLENFAVFAGELKRSGWTQDERSEPRWRGPSGSMIDLLPAGPELRRAGRISWPESEFEMSLAGFEHVFTRAVPFAFADNVQYRIAPPPVIALLKMVAFLDDPYRRQKDLLDLKELFARYEAGSDRIFSASVFAAELDDIDCASAFLLGIDVGSIVTPGEVELLDAFLAAVCIPDEEVSGLDREDVRQRKMARFQQQLRAFRKGTESATGPAATPPGV